MDTIYTDERLKQAKNSLDDARKKLCGYAEVGKTESVGGVDWTEKAEFFNEALNLVADDRAKQYGTGLQNLERIADLWSSYLGRQITPKDVCAMMILHKVSRIAQKKDEPAHDSWIDIAGYASLGDSVGKII